MTKAEQADRDAWKEIDDSTDADPHGRLAKLRDEAIEEDVKIEQLPPRRSEQVVVRFTQGSYRPPRIIAEETCPHCGGTGVVKVKVPE